MIKLLHKYQFVFAALAAIPLSIFVCQPALHELSQISIGRDLKGTSHVTPIDAMYEPVPGPNASCTDIVAHAEKSQCGMPYSTSIRYEACVRRMHRMFAECMTREYPETCEVP